MPVVFDNGHSAFEVAGFERRGGLRLQVYWLNPNFLGLV